MCIHKLEHSRAISLSAKKSLKLVALARRKPAMELNGEADRRLSRDDPFSKGCVVGSEPNGELIVGDLSSGKSEDGLGGVSF